MNCAECEKGNECCHMFFLFVTKDGKPDFYNLEQAGFPWNVIAIAYEELSGIPRFYCIMQDVDGKCIIYGSKPKTCDNFRC